MHMMSGALAPFRVHDIVPELAQKHYIMYPKMARSAFDPDIILCEVKKNDVQNIFYTSFFLSVSIRLFVIS